MDTVHIGHLDALHILLLDANVGASDGDGNTTVKGAESRNDLCKLKQKPLQLNLPKIITAV